MADVLPSCHKQFCVCITTVKEEQQPQKGKLNCIAEEWKLDMAVRSGVANEATALSLLHLCMSSYTVVV